MTLMHSYKSSLTELRPQRVVRVRLGQHVHAGRRVLLQEDLDGRLAVGHNRGHPSQVVGQDGRQQRREEPANVAKQTGKANGFIAS